MSTINDLMYSLNIRLHGFVSLFVIFDLTKTLSPQGSKVDSFKTHRARPLKKTHSPNYIVKRRINTGQIIHYQRCRIQFKIILFLRCYFTA